MTGGGAASGGVTGDGAASGGVTGDEPSAEPTADGDHSGMLGDACYLLLR